MTISLITVCYNSAEVIRSALESVLAQTWPEIEYIVIDGGSTDGTVEILREYEGKFGGEREGFKGSKVQRFKSGFKGEESTEKIDQKMGGKRMRWVSEQDNGMYDAINKGIRMATGEVVGLLNADDVLEDDRVVERIAQEFLATRNTKIDVVYGDVRFVNNCVSAKLPECDSENCVNALMPECVIKAITHSRNKAFPNARMIWRLCGMRRPCGTTRRNTGSRGCCAGGLCRRIRASISGGSGLNGWAIIRPITRSRRITNC